ncbi:MAG: hypothetical protein AB7F19_03735 [Candidatus Babeliales bacterium]
MNTNTLFAAFCMLASALFMPSVLAMKGARTQFFETLKSKPALTKCIVATAGLYTAGSVYDHVHEKKLRFVDVSTPLSLKTLAPVLSDQRDMEALTHSVTKRQFDQDWYYTYAPLAQLKAKFSHKYVDRVDGTLFAHFWNFLPTSRNRLTALVQELSIEEHDQRLAGNVTLVHGTSQGASIVLRTIFDEVLRAQEKREHFVKLRDDSTVADLGEYHDVHAYYDANIDKAPHEQVMQRIPGCGSMPTGEYTVLFDKGPAQKHLLSTNLGFFGQNCWWRDGYKDSSAEFVTRPSSWGYQALDVAIAGYAGGPLVALLLAGQVAWDLVKNPRLVTSFPALLDKRFKGDAHNAFMHDTFKEYGAQALYEKYRAELNAMESLASAGLLQLSIKEELAKKWCYLSEPLGIRTHRNPEALGWLEDPETQNVLWPHQARVLLHPELAKPENVSMRFYLLGKPEKLRAMTQRMYEIAQEVKDYTLEQKKDSV